MYFIRQESQRVERRFKACHGMNRRLIFSSTDKECENPSCFFEGDSEATSLKE